MRNGSKRLKDVLPKLAQIMAKDFRDFSDKWEEVLKTYAEVFKWLNEVLRWKDESIETTAVEIIENYIKARKKGTIGNEWFPAYGWLAYELGEMFYELMEELRANVYDPERDEDKEDFSLEPLL
jgi:hypothetical protein